MLIFISGQQVQLRNKDYRTWADECKRKGNACMPGSKILKQV